MTQHACTYQNLGCGAKVQERFLYYNLFNFLVLKLLKVIVYKLGLPIVLELVIVLKMHYGKY